MNENIIGNIYFNIFVLNKKLYSRKKIKETIINIKIIPYLKYIDNNLLKEYQTNNKLFIETYSNNFFFYKNCMKKIFQCNDICNDEKMELSINSCHCQIKKKIAEKTMNYLNKYRNRITSSTNSFLTLMDYIRFYEALMEDEHELKYEIHEQHVLLNSYKEHTLNDVPIFDNTNHIMLTKNSNNLKKKVRFIA